MRGKNADLHGNVPDQSATAILAIDLINDLTFPGGEELAHQLAPMGTRLAAFFERARAAGVPIVYVNDNFGKWRSEARQIVDHVLAGTRGAPITRLLAPQESDYFVIKPKNSGFYATTLGLLLDYLGARTLVLTGICTEVCVLFTANDAYMREFELIVPPDGVASFCQPDHAAALGLMERVLKARLTPLAEVPLEKARREGA